MSTTYVQPTMADVQELISTFKIDVSRTNENPYHERYYDWVFQPIDNQGPRLAIRWYTTVVPHNGDVGRAAGKDAFRICIVRNPGTQGERVVYSLMRVHRTAGWQDRVRARLRLAYKLVHYAPTCPACGARMVPQVAKSSRLFWSCSRFPNCKGSRRGVPGTNPETLLESLEGVTYVKR